MSEYFADTFYFLALLNRRDRFHDLVVKFVRENQFNVVTTEWVITELANSCSKPDLRVHVIPFIRKLERFPGVTILPYDHETRNSGMEMYASRPDKAWSLTDCISFICMRHRNLSCSLTNDHHFRQAGFQTVWGA